MSQALFGLSTTIRMNHHMCLMPKVNQPKIKYTPVPPATGKSGNEMSCFPESKIPAGIGIEWVPRESDDLDDKIFGYDAFKLMNEEYRKKLEKISTSEFQKPVNPLNVDFETAGPCDGLPVPGPRVYYEYGGTTRLAPHRLSDPDIVEYARVAVKEYNNRHEVKDTIEFVKVKKAFQCCVNGILYDLKIAARVVANGEGEEMTQTFAAKVWVKGHGTVAVLGVIPVRDATEFEQWQEDFMYGSYS